MFPDLPKYNAAPMQNMPVILPEKHYDQWLDREYKDTEKLKALLKPYPVTRMSAYAVSDYVNNTRNEGPQCMERVKRG
jgi:putative SOS response-associated peptidase YedK